MSMKLLVITNNPNLFFGLIFKLGVIVKEMMNFISGIITYCVFALLRKQKARSKSLAKIKVAAFLERYSGEFLFRI
jgi:hypothetical protein